jgi:hypothetical protein
VEVRTSQLLHNGPGSDVDLLVTFPHQADIMTLISLDEELSDQLTAAVDVVPARGTGPVLQRAARPDLEPRRSTASLDNLGPVVGRTPPGHQGQGMTHPPTEWTEPCCATQVSGSRDRHREARRGVQGHPRPKRRLDRRTTGCDTPSRTTRHGQRRREPVRPHHTHFPTWCVASAFRHRSG